MKYCPYCERMVNPTKKVAWLPLLVLCLLTGFTWLFIYIPYYCFFKSKQCPICGGTKMWDSSNGNEPSLNKKLGNASIDIVKKGIDKINKS